MHLYLHIGAAKTGTTALQGYLERGRETLLEQGIWMSRSAGVGNARRLPAAFMDPDRDDDLIKQRGLQDPERRKFFNSETLFRFGDEVMAARRAGCDRMIVSSEHFQSRLMNPAEVERCARFFREQVDDIEVLVYLRRQDKAATSLFSERLRAGLVPNRPLSELDNLRRGNKNNHFFNYLALLRRWSDAFGVESVRPCVYDRNAMPGGSILEDFCQRCGLPILETVDDHDAHTSLSMQAQAAMTLFNRSVGESARFETAVRERRIQLWRRLSERVPGPGRQPSLAEAESFMEFFWPMNREIATTWFVEQGKPVDHDTLFDQDFSNYPIEPEQPDWSAASVALGDALASLGEPEGSPL